MPSVTTERLCFVVGPIGDEGSDIRDHADWLLDGIIRPVFLADFPEYHVKRADHDARPGLRRSYDQRPSECRVGYCRS
jgi:hypothetical protein